MQFSICAEMVFPTLPFAERLVRVREAGFTAFEFWGWRDKDLGVLERAVAGGMRVATFSGQRRGSLVDPAHLPLYRQELVEALPVAERLGCKSLMILSDELSGDGSVTTRYPPMSPAERHGNMLAALRELVPLAERAAVTLLLEPLNTAVDHRGYALASSAEAFALVAAVASPHLKVLFDVYHLQIMEGNIIATLRANLPLIGALHVADVPGRHEPGTGELNYARILGALAEAGFAGHVGFEFQPVGDSAVALQTIRRLCDQVGESYRKS